MVSGSTRTAGLVSLPCPSTGPAHAEQLRLAACERLSEFVAAAARIGLDAQLAVRLALERALVLHDAQALRIDVRRARLALNGASAEARATRALGAAQARYVRELYDESPRAVVGTERGLSVRVPDDLLARARDTVPQGAMHEGAVTEMLAWERAARLQARTMSEWGLKTLGALIAAR
jgi:hypothetical protein